MLAVVACHCGSSDSLVRNYLRSINYEAWDTIPINKGKEKSRAVLNYLPPSEGKEMLGSFLDRASKWAVIIGYDDVTCKWSDIAHNGPKSRIEAEFVVQNFG